MDSSLIQWPYGGAVIFVAIVGDCAGKQTQLFTNARHQKEATKAKRGPYMKLSNELKSKSLVRTEILRQQDTFPSCSRLLICRLERNNYDAMEFNFAQSHVRENKSGEIFPQYYASGFGEIFP